MNKHPQRSVTSTGLWLAAIGLGLPGGVFAAAPGTWTGGGTDGLWSNTNNWLGGIEAIGNSYAYFNADVPNNTATLPTGYCALKFIYFKDAAGLYTIGGFGPNGGNTISLFVAGGGITLDASMTGSNVTETINAPLSIDAVGSTTFGNYRTDPGSKLVLAGDITCGVTTTSTLYSVAGSGTNLVSGVIRDGASGQTQTVSKTGAGQWTLSGSNTYSGGTILSLGTLNINNASALGAGPFVIGANTTNDNTSGGPIILLANNPMTWNGDFCFKGTSDLNLGAGAVSLGTNAGTTRTLTVSAGTLTVGGGIAGGTTVTNFAKAGNGTLLLAAGGGATTYAGTTAVKAGALLVDGVMSSDGGAVTVSNGATLGGTGFIYRAVTVASNATLAVGDSAVPGTLTTSNLTLLAGAIVGCDIAGHTADRVAVNGTLTLPGTARVNLNLAGARPNPAVLFSATSLAGATNSPLLTGWAITPALAGATIQIQGNDVVLVTPAVGTVVTVR